VENASALLITPGGGNKQQRLINFFTAAVMNKLTEQSVEG